MKSCWNQQVQLSYPIQRYRYGEQQSGKIHVSESKAEIEIQEENRP
jgi:hypothetical protein